MSGGRASRQKGNRTERAIVHVLQSHGFAAERVPLSGAARGRFGGDVSVPYSASIAASKSKLEGTDSAACMTGSATMTS
jgi:Holliday junction resolvase